MAQHDIQYELGQLIKHHTTAWIQQRSSDYTPTNPILQQALREQQEIGWSQFIEGFWTKKLLQSQTQHHHDNKIIKSPKLLISQLQRKVWHIAWRMWEHRNLFLHDTNYSFHPQEIKAIDTDIKSEWERGLDALPQQYVTLFNGTLERKLGIPHRDKLKWLATIWALRELQQPNYFQTVSTTTEPMTK